MNFCYLETNLNWICTDPNTFVSLFADFLVYILNAFKKVTMMLHEWRRVLQIRCYEKDVHILSGPHNGALLAFVGISYQIKYSLNFQQISLHRNYHTNLAHLLAPKNRLRIISPFESDVILRYSRAVRKTTSWPEAFSFIYFRQGRRRRISYPVLEFL